MASSSAFPPVETLYGAVYFGSVISTIFYGIACMQTFFYYIHYPGDPLRMKICVAVLWALDTVQETLSISGTYKYIMGGLTDPTAILNGSSDLVVQLLFACLVAVPVQGYLVHRIYTLSGSKFAPLLWVPLAIVQFVAVCYYVAKALYSVDGVVKVAAINVLNKDKPFTIISNVFLAVAVATDVLIAVALSFSLSRACVETGVRKTTHLLQRIVMFSVSTGALTAVFAIATLVLLRAFPENMLYAITGIPICSVYYNALFANLNAREFVGDMDRSTISMATFSTSFLGSGVDKRRKSIIVSRASVQQGIWKTTEVTTFEDVVQSKTSESIKAEEV